MAAPERIAQTAAAPAAVRPTAFRNDRRWWCSGC